MAKLRRTEVVGVRLEADIRKQLESICANEERTLSWMLNKLVKEFVSNQEVAING